MKKYFIQHHAEICTDNLQVKFERLFEDVRDQMSDDLRPEWSPLNDFYVNVSKIHTSYNSYGGPHNSMVVSKNHTCIKYLSFHGDKNFANNIWKIAKKYDNFDIVVNAARVLLEGRTA